MVQNSLAWISFNESHSLGQRKTEDLHTFHLGDLVRVDALSHICPPPEVMPVQKQKPTSALVLQVKELDLLEKIEKIANPLKAEGEWISYLDIVESGDKLVLKEMPEEGRCGTECKTIQKAAESILESADTDIAEKLWQVML